MLLCYISHQPLLTELISKDRGSWSSAGYEGVQIASLWFKNPKSVILASPSQVGGSLFLYLWMHRGEYVQMGFIATGREFANKLLFCSSGLVPFTPPELRYKFCNHPVNNTKDHPFLLQQPMPTQTEAWNKDGQYVWIEDSDPFPSSPSDNLRAGTGAPTCVVFTYINTRL